MSAKSTYNEKKNYMHDISLLANSIVKKQIKDVSITLMKDKSNVR